MNKSSAEFKDICFAEDLAFLGAQAAHLGGSSTLHAQTEAVLAKLEVTLKSAGLTFGDVVKVGVFYHQSVLALEADLLKKIREAFSSVAPLPVLTAIPLHHLPYNGLVQIELIALRPGSRRSTARKSAGVDPVHGFSSALRCDDMVFVGGKMSLDEQGRTIEPDSMAEQARVTMDGIKKSIRALGGDPQSVVKMNTYYVGYGTTTDWTTAARVRSDAFELPGPGATGVPVPGPYPDDILLRQEVIAVVNDDGSPKERETSWPEGVWDWPIPVSFQQGLKLDNLIVLGGQVSATTKGEAVAPGDLAAQTLRVMETIVKILGGFDEDCNCLKKLTILYATQGDPQDRETVIEIVRTFFEGKLPSLTLIPLGKLGFDGIEVEIEGLGIKS